MTRRLRVAVVGLGRWAQEAHLPAFAAEPLCELVAVADTDGERLRAARTEFSAAAAFPGLDELLEGVDVDLVDICTPHRTHAPLVLRAVAAGKHVLCEKPLALTLQEATGMAEAVRRQGVQGAVGFTFRQSPALRRLKEMLDEDFAGRIVHVQGFEQNSLFHDPLRPQPAGWSEDRGHSGALGEYASHLVDLVHWLCGDIQEVAADLANFVPERLSGGSLMPSDVDDSAVFLARLASGAHGVFQASWLATGRPPGVELRIFGDRGALWARLVEGPGGVERLWAADIREGIYRPVEIPRALPTDGDGTNWPYLYFTRLVRELAVHLLQGEGVEGDFADGLRSQAVLEAVRQAARERRWIQVAEQAR